MVRPTCIKVANTFLRKPQINSGSCHHYQVTVFGPDCPNTPKLLYSIGLPIVASGGLLYFRNVRPAGQ